MRDTVRSYRLLLVLGLAALIAATTGLALLSRQSPAGERSPMGDGERPTPARRPGVVCFGRVDLPRGPAALAPLQPGRVVKVHVGENETVAAGAPLLLLDDALVRPRVREAAAALRAARAQLAKAQSLPAQHEIRLAQQRGALAALTQRVTAAVNALALKQKLRGDRMLSAEDLAIAQAQRKEAEALRDVEAQKLRELELYDPRQDVTAAEAEVERAEARLAGAENALKECTVRAPSAGTVLRVLAAPGDVVGGPMHPAPVYFAAKEGWIVRAEVEQEFADQVAVGQDVTVEDEASGRLLCRGQATTLSHWYTRRRSPSMEPTQFNSTRTLECLITLAPGHPPLRLGQRVSVRFEVAP